MLTLDQLAVGQQGTVQAVVGETAILQRLLEFGLFEGENVQVLAIAPMGDPIEILCGYSRLSLRRNEASGVTVLLSPDS